jgi:hypothetical protein
MKKWARLNEKNVVVEILVEFDENEKSSKAKVKDFDSRGLVRVLESSPATVAAVGDSYLVENKVFVSPKPFPSWSFNEKTWEWEAPKPRPEGENFYWDEDKKDWLTV